MRFGLFTIAASAILLSGCIEMDLTLHVDAKGAAKIVEKVLFDTKVLDELFKMMEAFAAKGDSAPEPTGDRPWDFSKADLATRAKGRGPGVTLESAEPLVVDGRKGWTATYAVADINKLTLDPDPSSQMDHKVPGGESKKKPPMKFALKKGAKGSVLTIDVPQEEPSPNAKGKDVDPREVAQMKPLLAHLKIRVAVVIDGKIQSTTASHREGSTITLMDLDFAKISKDDKHIRAIASSKSLASIAKLPGIRIEQKPKVTVTFK